MMAGNVLGKGYTAGVGMSIGTAFGRIAGTKAALAAALRQAALMHKALEAATKTGANHAALEALTRDARALANGEIVLSAPEAEVARQMQICNACRYCEGFCAVFPAMTRRLEFGKADIHFLANLCHNCGACLHACQYAPPHEFAVNVPQAMAQVRGQTYADYAWPPALGQLYQRNGLTLSLALAAGLALFLVLAVGCKAAAWVRCGAAPGRQLLRLFPHNLLVGLFAPVFLFRGAGAGPGRAPLLARCDARHQRCAAERARHGRSHRCRAAPQVPGRRPRRRLPQRKRVATVPEVVEKLIKLGFQGGGGIRRRRCRQFQRRHLPRRRRRSRARRGRAVGRVRHRLQGAPAQRRRSGADARGRHADRLHLAGAEPRADAAAGRRKATVLAIDCLPRS
jgi:ferredoxin